MAVASADQVGRSQGASPCGRFAPSPTGDLHLGSLLAATGSYLSVRSQAGRWLVRMEDVDRLREVPGSASRILETLEAFGFEWDGRVEYQSRRSELYQVALERLGAAGLIYACRCSRSRLAQAEGGEPAYPGTCRHAAHAAGTHTALRFNTGQPGRLTGFADRLQGWFEQDVARTTGDFVVKRRDGFTAYQLAVVVDDAEQGVTEVVRGCDLLDNTPRQLLLQQALGLPQPAYAHLPLLLEPDGSKLAKRQRSVRLDARLAPSLLYQVLCLLRQSPPQELSAVGVREIWNWALRHWNPVTLFGLRTTTIEP